jgi:hypothetical protein
MTKTKTKRTKSVADIPSQVVAIDSIEPHPQNYNAHPEAQVEQLSQSVKEFAQYKNIVTWRGKIIAGEGVWRAMKLAGRTTIEVKDVSAWSKTRALALMAEDNEQARQSIPNTVLLAQIISEIAAAEGDALAQIAAGGQVAFDALSAQTDGRIVQDPNAEWQGMPELQQSAIMASAKMITVRFLTDEDIKTFAEAIGQTVTPQTKAIWFPKQDFDQNARNEMIRSES